MGGGGGKEGGREGGRGLGFLFLIYKHLGSGKKAFWYTAAICILVGRFY